VPVGIVGVGVEVLVLVGIEVRVAVAEAVVIAVGVWVIDAGIVDVGDGVADGDENGDGVGGAHWPEGGA
jgi:hypothetical protein